MSDHYPPCPPFDEDDDDTWQHGPTRPHSHGFEQEPSRPSEHAIPPYCPNTGNAIYACPACNSVRTAPRHLARRIGGALGAAAGGTSAIAAALSGAELGAAAGTLGGPVGVLCGAIAGAILAGLAGAAAGCAAGAALGERIDHTVLANWRCRDCGHAFSVQAD
ncbi:hypothetical protein SAMN02787142_3732 [Burkholderia sp. WP9]|uniref:hypothetical protein n=1 Tax=Burkholderia sp. WP9 TaxID=1500263 RepID=UPI00089C0AA4|nr:hypothetical protein [Burkholderia sp. WP9]SED73999.1 hypothetical protein SAMN02787142_3732 [Burkholderia sp. WP9]